MSKLDTAKRKLKSMGIAFTYEVEDDKSTITFLDSLGKTHTLIETKDYWLGRPNTKLVLNGNLRMDSQTEFCNWLDAHKTLLTDKEAYQAELEAMEAQKAEINRLRKREYFKFPYGNYELTVIKNLLGNISYRIATTADPERDMDYTPRLEVKFEGRHEDNPIVVISTGGYYEFDIEQAIYLQEALLGAIKAVEVFQKIIDKESKLPLTETK